MTSARESCRISIASGAKSAEKTSYRAGSSAARIVSRIEGSSKHNNTRRRCHFLISDVCGCDLSPASNISASARSGSTGPSSAGMASSAPEIPGSLGSSFGGGMIVTDWRQRGHSTLNGSVGRRVSSKVSVIAHCGQLAIILILPIGLAMRYSSKRLAQFGVFICRFFRLHVVLLNQAHDSVHSCVPHVGSAYRPTFQVPTDAEADLKGLWRTPNRHPALQRRCESSA